MSAENKKKGAARGTLICMAVLFTIAVVCTALLAVVNRFFPPYEAGPTELYALIQNICPTDGDKYTIVYDSESAEIKDYNAAKGTSSNYISYVFSVDDGEHKGKSVIYGSGGGYSGVINVLTAFNPDGTVYKFQFVGVGGGNDRWNKVEGVLGQINESVSGKDGGFTGNDFKTLTGVSQATMSMEGLASAMNISAAFYKEVILGEEEQKEVVTDTALIEKLNKIFAVEGTAVTGKTVAEYVKVPFSTPQASYYNEHGTDGKANISALYLGDGEYLIAEVKASAGGFGNWTMLVLLDKNTKKAVSIVQTANSTLPIPGEYESDKLVSDKVLTDIFAGKSADEIKGFDKYLAGSTGATETNNGAKAAVLCVLANADEMLAQI